MEFKEIELTINDDLLFRSVSTCGKIQIGVWPVLFGFRVRAGFVGDFYYHIDYCCGDRQVDVEEIYSIVKNILEQYELTPLIFEIFPQQNIKPIFNDYKNFPLLVSLIDNNYNHIKLPDIYKGKREYMNQFFN